MTCDEMKAFDVGLGQYCEDGSPCVVAFDADRNPRLLNEKVYLKSDVDAAIAELKAENERLKKCEIWMKQHFYCEEVIACESAKNRRLKRALWLAMANYCHNFRICWYINRHPGTKRTRSIIENTLIIAELKCRAKAEKYK